MSHEPRKMQASLEAGKRRETGSSPEPVGGMNIALLTL